MKSILSDNERTVFEIIFQKHDPDIESLQQYVSDKLKDKKGTLVHGLSDVRYISKLKSTGLKKITDSLLDIASSLRLDIHNPPKKYTDKIKACIKGLNFMLNAEIYIIFLLDEGPIAWYLHDSADCSECSPDGVCNRTLQQIILERNLILPDSVKNNQIDEQAEWVFNEILK